MYICSNVFEVYFYQLIFLLFLLADIPIMSVGLGQFLV